MKSTLYPFANIMQNLRGHVQERHRAAAIAIGYACACNTILPSSEVENAEQHYKDTAEKFAKQIISELNEVTVFDAVMAMEFARKFWLLRYEAVHKCPRLNAVPGDFFASVFGVQQFFSSETVEFVNKQSDNIATVYAHVCHVIKDHYSQG